MDSVDISESAIPQTRTGTISELIGTGTGASRDVSELPLQDVLATIRSHLRMDVAFISEFIAGNRVFICVNSRDSNSAIRVGGSDPLETTYCQRVVDGRLPGLIPDVNAVPAALALEVTQAHQIGAHLSVPIVLQNGRVYGTFCCISHKPDRTLNERDLDVMRALADLTARRIDRELVTRNERQEIEDRIRFVLSSDDPLIVYQPIYDFPANRVVGFESLSRFATEPKRAPDAWFNEAARIGLGSTLELKAIRTALKGLDQLPDYVYLSVNVSPETILGGEINGIFNESPINRVKLELTEHAAIDRYSDIASALRPLRDQGLRIAVDDAGAGYASFRHILSLDPDVIKLDTSITRNIHVDKSRRALTSAFVAFSRKTGSQIVAEGVETAAELDALKELGVTSAQGYFLGKPMPLASALSLCRPT